MNSEEVDIFSARARAYALADAAYDSIIATALRRFGLIRREDVATAIKYRNELRSAADRHFIETFDALKKRNSK